MFKHLLKVLKASIIFSLSLVFALLPLALVVAGIYYLVIYLFV